MYRYALELFREDGSALGHAAITVDWQPAEEWARLVALRHAAAPGSAGGPAAVRPIWHATSGEPYMSGFRVVLAAQDGDLSCDFTNTYFEALASRAAARLVDLGKLKVGDHFKYVATAFRQEEELPSAPRIRFTTEEVAPDLRIEPGSLGALLARAATRGSLADGDVPVFLPQAVLDEAAALAAGAGEKETGGILIGELHRDPESGDLFVQVTVQIPARHTEADLTKLTFTGETWTEVRAALELRRRHEIMLGWWHSHPVREWCKACPPERQRVCRLAVDFFSEHDRALHRAVFPKAYSVALVVNDLADGATYSMFGWREGLQRPRGFHVIGAAADSRERAVGAAAAPHDEECVHASQSISRR